MKNDKRRGCLGVTFGAIEGAASCWLGLLSACGEVWESTFSRTSSEDLAGRIMGIISLALAAVMLIAPFIIAFRWALDFLRFVRGLL